MTEAERLAERLEALLAKATPGPWGIWFEQIDGKADRAIQELVEQVHATNPIGNSLVMLDADGKCPAITGCGPTSVANAALIVEAVNALPTLLARIAALGEALRGLEPYLDAIVCYASDMGEHEPNRLAFNVRKALGKGSE